MLRLTLYPTSQIEIEAFNHKGEPVKILIHQTTNRNGETPTHPISLGVTAPKEIPIHRAELDLTKILTGSK